MVCSSHRINESVLDEQIYKQLAVMRDGLSKCSRQIESDIRSWMSQKNNVSKRIKRLQDSINVTELEVEQILMEKIKEKGCPKVVVNDLARCDMAEAVEDAFRYGKLVLATTTYNADVFPFMREFIHHLTERNFQNRTVAFIENGSWAPVAEKVMRGMLEKSKHLTYAENSIRIMSAMNEENKKQIESLAEEFCKG